MSDPQYQYLYPVKDTTRPVNSLPESPWAKHFWPANTDPTFRLLGDGVHHSGLAPVFPYTSWDQIGRLNPNVLPLPNMNELDILFYSERNQRQKRSGVMSWRLPVLVQAGNLLSDNIDMDLDPKVIKVDEDNWLNFLKRSRWFDLRVDAISGIPNPHPDLLKHSNNWWTADNSTMWKYMRISLELANRVFNMMIETRHPWLDTVLFAPIQIYAHVNQEMRDHCDEHGVDSPQVMFERPADQRATSAEMRQQLEHLLQACVLGFIDENSHCKRLPSVGLTGFTWNKEGVKVLNDLKEGDINAVIPALQSTRDHKSLPRYIKKKRPAAGFGNIMPLSPDDLGDGLGPPADESESGLIPLEDFVARAAAQIMKPDGTVFDAAQLAAAVQTPVSADEFKLDPIDTHISAIHVHLLRSILNTESKPSERYNSLVLMSITILHELCHSIFFGRLRQANFGYSAEEPFIMPHMGSESGLSFETTLFGGISDTGAIGDDAKEHSSGANTHMFVSHWPELDEVQYNIPETWHSQFAYPVGERHYWNVPSLWSASMLSEEFWQTVVSRWGAAALHAPMMLKSLAKSSQTFYGTRAYSARLTPIEHVKPEMLRYYTKLQDLWQQTTVWNKIARPWWEEQSRKWSLSPWSQIEARKWILEFREAHARRDIFNCTKLVLNMIRFVGELGTFDPSLGLSVNLWACIAGLMLASIPVMTTEQGWKGPEVQFWAHPSLSAALKWTKPITFHPNVIESFRERFEYKPVPWSQPSEGLTDFSDRFCPMGMAGTIPHAWLEACYNAFQKLWAHHYSWKGPHGWAEFDFQIPAYDDQWVTIMGETMRVNFYNLPLYHWVNSSAPAWADEEFYMPSPPPSPIQGVAAGSGSFDTTQWQGARKKPPTSARRARRAGSRSRSHGRTSSLYPLHFSTGEVGNNMDDEDFWIIEYDGNSGYDIFSISKLCHQMGFPTADMIRRELITLSPLGPKLREDGHPAADQIRLELQQSCRKVGRLLLPRTIEQISEYDGQDGMPLWIIIGTTVYDITSFGFGTQSEEAQLTENPGGRPTSLPDASDVYDDLLKRLRPFRCALFEGQKAPKKTELPPFTPTMLRWHDNPTSGMYIAVDGIVYNVATYIDRHPGGRDIMGPTLGREASNFHEFHAANTMDGYEEFSVGRLVPEIPLEELREHHVVIHDWVFDLSKLEAEGDQWIYPVLEHLGGKDASEAIKNQDATSSALVHVYDRKKEVIVGHVAPIDLGEIPMGEVAKHNNPQSLHGAWVTIEGYVFDVTTLMLHGKAIHGKELPYMWAGRELRDEGLRKWLRGDFQHRIIGRTVAGEAIQEPTVDELLNNPNLDADAGDQEPHVWDWDKNDVTCGGRVAVHTRGREHVHSHTVASAGPNGRKRRSSSAADDDAAVRLVKRRGLH